MIEEARLAVAPMSRGSWVVFTAKVDDVKVMFICYKYNYEDAPVCFMTTVGSSAPGRLYYVNYSDEHGNITNTAVQKPACITDYHDGNTIIDDRNSLRQNSLAIERKLPTQCPFTKVVTAVIGEYAVDVMKFVTWLGILDHGKLGLHTADDWMNFVCSIIFCKKTDEDVLAREHAVCVAGNIYKLTMSPMVTRREGGKPKRQQKACLVCGRKKKRDGTKGGYKHLTSFYCPVPGCGGAGVCSPCHGRACFRAHLKIRHGIGAPAVIATAI